MANLTQTAANVKLGSIQTAITAGLAGESITEGMPVYKATDGSWYQDDANSSAAAAAVTNGIAMTPASTGEPFVIATRGSVNLGATLQKGKTYAVSATKGAICPEGDLTTGDYVKTLGVATSTSLLTLNVNATGVLI